MKRINIALFAIVIIGLCSFSSADVLRTSLKLKVLNELGNIEEGASVQLYSSEEDYRAETNPVTEVQYTDKKGEVKFKDLEPKTYFINAEKGDKNNIGAGVQTDVLEEGKMNKITIVIE
ncbi:carboxypeptidase regulatory-like domain-containing protein [Fulvivirga sediminis]|uniref:Carboxypeptidase regulatory-like domain-containing protein n=1 Tax=Fulvivirga sediminis TaxID=2803949 RepID=A0A937K0M6_9BACT|nr:carboxypeptidase regulatory-like domain-containing protein [Fulvivirga sediminis]MBL3658508.1 carboxypeptidase regulatory-like domain-containing protein [Fulvivirga sediminis]